MIETETPAERRLRAVHEVLTGERELVLMPIKYAPAIDMGREALATGREIVAAYDGYRARGMLTAEQQYQRMVEAIQAMRALLARAGEE